MFPRIQNLAFLWILIFCLGSPLKGLPKTAISGQILLDTSIWESNIYLSLIPEFSQLNTMSYANIIERTPILEDGSFEFNTTYLSHKDQFYRIHISKKGDPPASLIIGGKDHNHFFLIANRESNITIRSSKGKHLFNQLTIKGYQPSDALQEINNIVGLLDTLDFFGSNVNGEFIREAVNNRLEEYADTCTHELVAAYALLRSGQDPNRKSPFLRTLLQIVILFIFLASFYYLTRWLKPKKKNPLAQLTLQERKIHALLKEGKSNKEIADECAVSVSTVKSHVNSIYSKLGVSSRKEVVDI